MKKSKFIVIAMVLTAMLFTGCSKGKPDEKTQEKSKSGKESAAETAILFGKVNAVTGNELEILLAKDPSASQPSEDKANADGSTAAAEVTGPATAAGEEVPPAPKMQLEYTGDEKSVIVPAGAKILDLTGAETKLDSVKKGSVIMILMENNSVKEVGIME